MALVFMFVIKNLPVGEGALSIKKTSEMLWNMKKKIQWLTETHLITSSITKLV